MFDFSTSIFRPCPPQFFWWTHWVIFEDLVSSKKSNIHNLLIGYECSKLRNFNFFFQAEDGIRDRSPSRGLGDVYKRQALWVCFIDSGVGVGGNDTRATTFKRQTRSLTVQPSDPDPVIFHRCDENVMSSFHRRILSEGISNPPFRLSRQSFSPHTQR